ILFHLLDQRTAVKRAVLLLQREVAERIAAEPGGRDYGLLSVLIQHVADARIGLSVPRRAFTPPPEVESCALVLEMLPEPRAAVTTVAALLHGVLRDAVAEGPVLLLRLEQVDQHVLRPDQTG